MLEALAKVSTPILIFILGYILKKTHVLKKENGELFLKLVFYIVLPSLYLVSIPNITLSPSLIFIPLFNPFIIFSMFALSFVVGKLLHLSNRSLGVFLIATMIMNTSFVLPFVLATYGNSGLVIISLIDGVNALFTFSFTYFIACKFGEGEKTTKYIVQKVFLAPPIWAMILGFAMNLTGTKLPFFITNFLQAIGNLATPLIMLSLGTYFTFKITKLFHVTPAILIRYGFGLVLGLVFVTLFHLEGLTKAIVITAAAAPVGFNTLTFSSLENLDIDFAASIISVAMMLGLILVPLLLVIIH